jgi:hypothetical protein
MTQSRYNIRSLAPPPTSGIDTQKPSSSLCAAALLPLTDEQIRELAAVKGGINPDDMLADIKRRNAKEFARRPEDLIELCQGWQTENRIRAHLDQVRISDRVPRR